MRLAVQLGRDEATGSVRVHLTDTALAAQAEEMGRALRPPRTIEIVGGREGDAAEALPRALAADAPGTLLVPRDRVVDGTDTLEELVDRLDCPILIVS